MVAANRVVAGIGVVGDKAGDAGPTVAREGTVDGARAEARKRVL